MEENQSKPAEQGPAITSGTDTGKPELTNKLDNNILILQNSLIAIKITNE
jgi:hypothetical protein